MFQLPKSRKTGFLRRLVSLVHSVVSSQKQYTLKSETLRLAD